MACRSQQSVSSHDVSPQSAGNEAFSWKAALAHAYVSPPVPSAVPSRSRSVHVACRSQQSVSSHDVSPQSPLGSGF